MHDNSITVFIWLCNYLVSSIGKQFKPDTDKRYCGATANSVAPTYICRNPLMCAPDEVGIALERIAQNNAAYDRCMIQKGYRAQ